MKPQDCKATRQGDEYFCSDCGIRWGVNNEDYVPRCQTPLEGALARGAEEMERRVEEQSLPDEVAFGLPSVLDFENLGKCYYALDHLNKEGPAHRLPLKGEYYISGTVNPAAYKAKSNLPSLHWIVKPTYRVVEKVSYERGEKII